MSQSFNHDGIRKRDRSEKPIIGYVSKKKRMEQQNEIYTPDITVKVKNDDIEINEELKKYSQQNFIPTSKIPEKLYTVLNGHTNAITNIQWHPIYGHLLVSSSLDKTIKLWSVFPNKGEVMSISHKESVKDIKWSCDGRNLISGGLDNYVNVVDVETGKCVHSYKHNEWITSICCHPSNPSLFLSGGNSKGIVSWDTRISKTCNEYYDNFGSIQDMVFLDKEEYSFLSSAEIIKRNSSDQGLIVWDFRTGARLSNQIYLEGYTCTSVACHPTESAFIAQSTAGYIALFESMKPYRLNKKKRYEGHRITGYKIGCSFSRDGHYIVTGTSSGCLTFYDYQTSHLVQSIKVFNKSACMTAQYHPLYNSTIAVCSWSGKIAVLDSYVCFYSRCM